MLSRCCEEMLKNTRLLTPGIFRVPGEHFEIQKLQRQFESSPQNPFRVDLTQTDTHAITALIKSYLRDLPEPLVPFAFYGPLVEFASGNLSHQTAKKMGGQAPGDPEGKRDESAGATASIISIPPEILKNISHPHKQSLKYFIDFLACVAKHSALNLMSADNLVEDYTFLFLLFSTVIILLAAATGDCDCS